MGKVPLQVLEELEHQARQNLSTNDFTATFAKTASACNTTIECQHSIKTTVNRVKLYVLVSSALPTTRRDMTCTVLKAT